MYDPSHVVPRRLARVLAVTSGKGGVGKTQVAVGLAVALAQLGQRVTLVDMDLGMGNVDILFNLRVRRSLGDVLAGFVSIPKVVQETAFGVRVVPGLSGDQRLSDASEGGRRRLSAGLEYLQSGADWLILDTGAGIARSTLRFVQTADEAVVVTTPEPTALMDAYGVIKALTGPNGTGDLHLLANMARTPAEGRRAIAHVSTVARRFLQVEPKETGYLPYDAAVGESVRRRTPLLHAFPDSEVSQNLREFARRLQQRTAGRSQPPADQPGFVNRMLTALTGS